MGKYTRLYCEKCKTVFAKQAIGLVTHCPTCGDNLELKSFSPLGKIIGAAALSIIGIITITAAQIPLMWFGAFFWAASLIYRAFNQLDTIKKLDAEVEADFSETPTQGESNHSSNGGLEIDDSYQESEDNQILVKCGKCSNRYSIVGGQGIVELTCPNCGKKSVIMT